MASQPSLLGNRLLLAITGRGLNITQAAERIPMQKSQFSRILTGETDPKWSTVERICAALDIPVNELTEARKEAITS